MTALQNQSWFGRDSERAHSGSDSPILWEAGELVFRRGWRLDESGERRPALIVLPADEHPSRSSLERLTHEYELKDQLGVAWAVRPLDLVRDAGRIALVLDDVNGEPVDKFLGAAMELGRFLVVGIAIAVAVGKLHGCGLIHKDLKPVHILIDDETGRVRLTGFGIASRLERERESPQPPETIVGSLAYMAPEQTGRMNRSIDSRSDLYALGVTFYEMLTGAAPFAAADAMEWVHCHVARRPVAPAERVQGIPGALSAIVMKLLAKRAEDRYQTAAGLERDLHRCQTEWDARRCVDDFPLGKHDTPDRLLIPEKLYGREREVETLLASFDRVVKGGAPELVLVSGYSGVGKSSVVSEMRPALVPQRGLFASGKFDQAKRDVPYSTLAQAFRSLVGRLLGKSEADLAPWREALRKALGLNAGLIVDLVPELKAIIGSQPPVPEVLAQDAQRRFQLVFRQFIGVFARPEHPLALFLDDLQWLDPATLDLLQDLLNRADLRHLLLIGAYRDNEVDATHPLTRKLETMRASGRVHSIKLGPLPAEDLVGLVADSLRIDAGQATPLADLVQAKTGGNPFFVIQFLHLLASQNLVTFDHEQARWAFDLRGIQAKQHTDNVVELLARKLGGLARGTQAALQELACLGNVAEVATLAIVLGISEEGVREALWESQQQQLVERLDDSYRFVHDRVQEAAYALIPEASRAQTHLSIGRLLAAHTPLEKRDEKIFEIVHQLNRGLALMDSRDEKDQLAELNLIAGKRAGASTAHLSALHYFVLGAALLTEDGWQRRPELMFALEVRRAECEFLTGDHPAAKERLLALSLRAANVIDRATIAALQIEVYTTLNQIDRALDVFVDYLSHLGIEWSSHPTDDEVRREYDRTWTLLGRREIEELIELPLMSSPEAQATIEVLTKAITPALFSDPNLLSLVLWRMVNLSLEFGHAEASCQAYAHLWMSAGRRFGNYDAGFRFGRLSVELVERRGLKRFEARTYLGCAVGVASFGARLRTARDFLRRGFEAANTAGDLTYATFSWHHLLANLLMCGDPLVDAQREAERGLAFAEQASFGLEVGIMRMHLAHIRSLRGLTATFGCLDDEHFDELEMERELQSDWRLVFAEWRYWMQKLNARFLADDHVSAVHASRNVERLAAALPTSLETAEGHFYGALSHAAACDPKSPVQSREHLEALATHREQLQGFVAISPETLQCRAALVDAEIARLEDRELDAERLYEKAIKSARENEFVQNEAIANELAARFHAGRGFETIANAYLREARSCYSRWGADGKVRQLEARHPFLRESESARATASTIAAPSGQLDFATVVKVSQAVSSEMVLEKLIDALMRLALEHAGAERGLLLLWRDNDLRQEAEALTGSDGIVVRRGGEAGAMLPVSIVHYVMRSREVVLLDDASAHPTYASDSYVRERQARAILCLPLVNEAKVIGVLYLENNLAPYAFTPDRVTVLKVLASQAAISLENARLYRDLQAREAKVRRLVDSDIIGIFIWNNDGRILDTNDAFLRIIGYEREELVSGRVRWPDFTVPDWEERAAHAVERMREDKVAPTQEWEYVRKDGKRVQVLAGGAAFDESGEEGVAFILDLTDVKRAEQAVRDGEQRYHELQLRLADANRIASIGELSASIAHEINQPLSGIVTNANTCLRALAGDPPNVELAGEATRRALRDANRASGVIIRLRALFARNATETAPLDLNDLAREVLELARHDIRRERVVLRLELTDGPCVVNGDRVQLEQVILNLLRNAIDSMRSIDDRARRLTIGTARNESDEVLLSVKDSGAGFGSQDAGRLFEAFFTTKKTGMGIGLSVSRSIIEAHRGRLWATANEGPGATFSLSLPLEAEPQDNASSA